MMTALPSAAPEAGAVARPIGARERLALIDVVRGFALGGVFVSNVNVWFSGKVLLPNSGLFAAQMLISHLWMSRFRFGPAEWLWRSLTYGRRQPMRLDPVEAEAAP
jgi:uncharacterized protein